MRASAEANSINWKELLLRGKPDKKTGEPGGLKPCLFNVNVALRYSPEWEGSLEYNEFSQRVRLTRSTPIGGEVPRDLSDTDITDLAIWMQGEHINVVSGTVGEAAYAVAMSNKVNPVREWLKGLAWDGVHRVDSWLWAYMGAAKDDYTSKVGRWWLLSAVARVLNPGCQADHMLILEGPQGKGKSTALRILAGDKYFTDQIPDISTKDASLQLFGKWILEWGELESMGRSEVEAIKSFITRRVETLRPPYGKTTIDVPRQCVFAGSTNNAEYLKDTTGNRRFWPVKVGDIDLAGLAAVRDQLWAEAVAMYNANLQWWPHSEDWIKKAAEQAALRVEGDVWAETVSAYTANKNEVRVEDILLSMGMLVRDMKQSDRLRVARCLRILGFEADRDDDNRRCFKRKA